MYFKFFVEKKEKCTTKRYSQTYKHKAKSVLHFDAKKIFEEKAAHREVIQSRILFCEFGHYLFICIRKIWSLEVS
jgi:hypothetical protein